MSKVTKLGIIGCGDISNAYIELSRLFRGIEVAACADLNMDKATAQASKFGIQAQSIQDLLDNQQVEIIVNLTIPAAHFEVSARALSAGKHVFSEKPFVLSLDEAKQLGDLAAKGGLRVGSAPDTFLGAAHQHTRALVDQGVLGQVTGGTAAFMNPGMEDWHPNPDFFYQRGGGPILDMGPYYVTNLVQLLGPVRKVVGFGSTPRQQRLITSQPRHGEYVNVETPTSIRALLEFHQGATIALSTCWDVQSHGLREMELYGEKASLYAADPNHFGGQILVKDRNGSVELEAFDHPFSKTTWAGHDSRKVANYRTVGLADMASAITEGRAHRCSLELATHVIDVLMSIMTSCDNGGETQTISTSCERPDALSAQEAQQLLA